MPEAIVRYTSALGGRSQHPCTVCGARDRRSIRMTTVSAADPIAVETILQSAAGAVLPRCLHAVANLGVADALGDTPQSAEMLAKATGTNADALARTLRLLAANGVFEYREGLFAHTSASWLLRDDHPQSMRPLVRMFGLPAFWKVIGEMEYSVRTGLPAGECSPPRASSSRVRSTHPPACRSWRVLCNVAEATVTPRRRAPFHRRTARTGDRRARR